MAHKIFKENPGTWQIRQIEGADHAIAFWRKVISEVDPHFKEEKVSDEFWGKVTRQTFKV